MGGSFVHYSYATYRIVMPSNTKTMNGERARHRSRDAVLSAAAQILREEGYSGLTMERVAAESGVAKTTLYRAWPTKAALCMTLYLREADRELHVPNTGSVESDLRYIANQVVYLQTRTVAGPAFRGLIAEAQLNPSSREAFLAEFAHRRRRVTQTVLRRAIGRGQLRPGTDVDLFIDALGGAVTFRLLQGHAPLTTDFTDALIALLISGCKSEESYHHETPTERGRNDQGL